MKQLWAPWRMAYVDRDSEENGCVFCNKLDESDSRHALVLAQTRYSVIMLNKYGTAVLSVREEMRKNLVHCLESGKRILPGIVGYDYTVIPEIENALLSGHHMVFLGERGQGKSR